MNKFITYEGGVSGKRRDKVNEVNYTGMVIKEGRDIEGIRRFNSNGEGILRYINTNKVREVIIDIKRRVIIKRYNTSPPYIKYLINKAKRGEETAPDSILPGDTGMKAQSTYSEIGEQGTDSLTGIKAQGVISSPAPLFALENIAKIDKDLKHPYLSIYKIFS